MESSGLPLGLTYGQMRLSAFSASYIGRGPEIGRYFHKRETAFRNASLEIVSKIVIPPLAQIVCFYLV